MSSPSWGRAEVRLHPKVRLEVRENGVLLGERVLAYLAFEPRPGADAAAAAAAAIGVTLEVDRVADEVGHGLGIRDLLNELVYRGVGEVGGYVGRDRRDHPFRGCGLAHWGVCGRGVLAVPEGGVGGPGSFVSDHAWRSSGGAAWWSIQGSSNRNGPTL